MAARRRGEDIVDMSMGNPDGATPPHIVAKLVDAAQRPDTHGYSASKGIPRLRRAISHWYRERHDVEIDPDKEAIVTIGSKEGLAHLMLATLDRGDTVLVPDPSYPIHIYGAVIAGADIRSVPLTPGIDFFAELERAIRGSYPKPKMIVLGFPSNPTAACVELDFFERVIALARKHDIFVVHDLAYADIVFDGWKAPSIMQVPGAQGHRGGVFHALQELQHGGLAHRLHGRQPRPRGRLDAHQELPRLRHLHAAPGGGDCRAGGRPALREGHRRPIPVPPRRAGQGPDRGRLARGNSQGVDVHLGPHPRALPRAGLLEFAKQLLAKAKVSVSPGIGFGDYGDEYVRFALIENESRIRQAVRGIKSMFRADGLIGAGA